MKNPTEDPLPDFGATSSVFSGLVTKRLFHQFLFVLSTIFGSFLGHERIGDFLAESVSLVIL